MASPAVAGAVALLLQRHPTWSPADLRSALALTAKPAYANPARTIEAQPLEVGSGLIDVTAADATPLLSPDASADFGLVEAPSDHKATVELRNAGTRRRQLDGHRPRADGARDARRARHRRRAADARARRAAPARPSATGRATCCCARATARCGSAGGATSSVRGCRPRRCARSRSAPSRATRAGGTLLASHYAFPDRPNQLGLPASYPGREQVLVVPRAAELAQRRRARDLGQGRSADPARSQREPPRGRDGAEPRREPVPRALRQPRARLGHAAAARGPLLRERRDAAGLEAGAVRAARLGERRDAAARARRLAHAVRHRGRAARRRHRQPERLRSGSLEVTVDGRSADSSRVSGDHVTIRLGKLKPGRHRVRISVADYQELKNSENANASPLPNTRVVHATVVVK